jgi:phage/plasmid-like protein (TIGR03299 family)
MHAVETMFSGENLVPWHGIGTVIDGLATAADALKFAELDWTVEKQPLYFGSKKELFSGRHATVRVTDNHELGIVGDPYQVFQNTEAFEFFDNVVDTGEAKYTSAGSLFGGKRVFMTAQVGDEFLVAGEDPHKTYLLITNSHDGSQAFTAALTHIRAVCNNTVTMALNGASHKWSLRHQTSLSGKVAEAREALQMTFKYHDAFELEVQKMMAIPFTEKKMLNLANTIVPEAKVQKKKTVESLMDIYKNEKTVVDAAGAGTAWAAFNTVTFFSDHVKKYHNDTSRFKSLADAGFGEKLRNKAHTRIMAMSK